MRPSADKPGDQPALTPQEIDDVVAFLGTLTDGYFDPRKGGRRPRRAAELAPGRMRAASRRPSCDNIGLSLRSAVADMALPP